MSCVTVYGANKSALVPNFFHILAVTNAFAEQVRGKVMVLFHFPPFLSSTSKSMSSVRNGFLTFCLCHVIVFFQDIDEYICQAKDKSYDTLVHFGRKGLNVAATAAVMAATKVTQTPDLQVEQALKLCVIVCNNFRQGLLSRYCMFLV